MSASTVSFNFEGKLVLVTGSSKGIGYAIARGFRKAGANVFVNGRSDASVDGALAKLQEEVPDAAGTLHGLVADVSTADGCTAAVAAVEAVGTLDVLVNNTGRFKVCDVVDVPDEEWMSMFETNVMSGVRLTRAFLPGMLERNAGSVIFISSECGLRPIPHMIPYSMTKAAQISIARGLAELTKGTAVRVNSVLPGPTMTEGVSDFLGDIRTKRIADLGPDADPAAVDALTFDAVAADYFRINEPTSLLARFLDVDEVANVVIFLSSDAAAGINGAAQKVEGGIVRAM